MAPQFGKQDAQKLKTITINGLLPTLKFQKAKCCAEVIHPICFFKRDYLFLTCLFQKGFTQKTT